MTLGATLTIALQFVAASPAMAHATLISTSPTDDEVVDEIPSHVELNFDEPVQVVEGGVRVFGPDGDRVDRGRAAVDGSTVSMAIEGSERGTYTTAWRVLSGDGHSISGSFIFHFGGRTGSTAIDDAESPLVAAAGALGRFLALAGSLALFGAAMVWWISRFDPPVGHRLRILATAAAISGILGSGLVLIGHAAESSGRSLVDALPLVPDLITDTRTGGLVAARWSLFALAAAWLLSGRLWRRAVGALPAFAFGTMVLTTLAGHAWTADPRLLALVSDLGHQVAAAAWAGGIAALVLVVRMATSRTELARRFSRVALIAAGFVVATGTITAIINLGSWGSLISTTYGRLVAAKVAGFLVLVGLGWLNRRRLLPIFEKAAAPLLRSMRWELLVAIGVLAVTAFLVDQPPDRPPGDRPFSYTVTGSQITLQVSISPATVGTNDLHLYFFDTASRAMLPVDAVELTASTAQLPPRRLEVIPVSASHFSAYGVSFPVAGEWTIEVTTVRAGATSVTNLEVPIR